MQALHFSNTLYLPFKVRLITLPIPRPEKYEILVRNICVASNPRDWKYLDWFPDWEVVEGMDLAGFVEAIGEGVEGFEIGDRVAAFSKRATKEKHGAYAEYTVTPAHTTFKLSDRTSFEEGCTLPLAVMTAFLGLFRRLDLQEPPLSASAFTKTTTNGQLNTTGSNGTVVINGASSSVGAYAVQIAKKSGYTIVGVAGSSSDYAKELGADMIVDYRGKTAQELGQAIQAAVDELNLPLKGVLDAVSTEESTKMLAKSIMQPNGGNMATVLPLFKDGKGWDVPNVTLVQTNVHAAHNEDSEFAEKWYRAVEDWLAEGSFRPNRVKVMSGGLDSVWDGLLMLKDGKVHAEKLVYRVVETGCLKGSEAN